MELDKAIKKTLAYASFFHYTPSQEEVHHWLISPKIFTPEKTNKHTKNFVAQKSLSVSTTQKIEYAQLLASKLRYFSWIKMLAITGSVAANNSQVKDDIDIMCVTRANTLWITRPLFLIYLSLFFKRRKRNDKGTTRDLFCPNLWLDEQSLELQVSNRNLYTAHEILQIIPIINREQTYEKFITQNFWVKKHLANAYYLTTHNHSFSHSVTPSLVQNLFDKLLVPVNLGFYFLQYLYMLPYKTTEKTSLYSAFLHTVDYNNIIKKHLT